MSNEDSVASVFEVDVAGHVMTVESEDGIHRCIRFGKPDSNMMSFRLITYPGGLTYTGDMGTYVFERTHDMFRFFRGRRINPDYWVQKCEAGEVREPSIKSMLDTIGLYVNEFAESYDLDEEAEAALLDEVRDDSVVNSIDAFIEWASSYRLDVDTPHGVETFDLPDIWEHTLTEYTYRFIWCLHAIVWGISVYDAMEAGGSDG